MIADMQPDILGRGKAQRKGVHQCPIRSGENARLYNGEKLCVLNCSKIRLLVLISLWNWINLEWSADDDTAGQILYYAKIWETGNIFSPEYAHATELFVSRPWLLYIVFYSLTGNIIVSAKLGLIASMVILTITTAYLFRKLGWTYPEIFVALAVFLGLEYNNNEFMILLRDNAYVVFLTGEILTLAMLINTARGKRLKIAQIAVLIAISVFFGICGIRMLLYLYMPVFLFEIIRYIQRKLKRKKVTAKPIIFASILLGANLAGIIIYRFVITPYMRFVGQPTDGFYLTDFSSLWNDIIQEMTWLVRAFGIVFERVPVVSRRGILTVFNCTLLVIVVWIICVSMKERVLSHRELKTLGYLTTSAILLFCYFVFTMGGGFPRYWLETIPLGLTILAALAYRYLYQRGDLKMLCNLYSMFLIAGILIACAASPYKINHTNPTPVMQLTDYLQDKGYDRIASTYWNHSIVTFLSNGEIEGPLIDDSEALGGADWMTDRSQWSNDDEPMTIIVGPDQREAWLSGEKRGHLLSSADKTEEVAGYSIYYFNKNPLAFNLLQFGKEARLNFLTLSYGGGAYLRDCNIVLPNGGAQYGPYCSVDAGTYDVLIRGENLDAGIFDVVSGPTAELNGGPYEMNELVVNGQKVTFSFHIDAHAEGLEIRCFNQSEKEIVIQDITILPIDQKPLW